MKSTPLGKATGIATILQCVMVLLGDNMASVANLFPVLGTAIGGLGGFLFSRWSPDAPQGKRLTGGVIAGGVSGLLGTIVSVALGTVPVSTIAVGTGSSGVAGAIGGYLAKMVGGKATV